MTRAGIAQWLEHRAYDRKVAGSNPCTEEQWEKFLLQGQSCVLTLISPVSVPPPCYRSGTQKTPVILCRWQVTAKHACTLRMWLCMK